MKNYLIAEPDYYNRIAIKPKLYFAKTLAEYLNTKIIRDGLFEEWRRTRGFLGDWCNWTEWVQ